MSFIIFSCVIFWAQNVTIPQNHLLLKVLLDYISYGYVEAFKNFCNKCSKISNCRISKFVQQRSKMFHCFNKEFYRHQVPQKIRTLFRSKFLTILQIKEQPLSCALPRKFTSFICSNQSSALF